MTGEVKILAKAAMHIDYRHCAELHGAIALGALLRPASHADGEAVARQMDVYKRELDACGKPFPAEFPMAREVFVARSREEAMRLARDRKSVV